MKKLILMTLFSLFLLPTSQAYVLEAKSVKDLVDSIQKTEFTYRERGMIFGYATIQSCLYVSKDIVILKNYCYPAKNYPAKSFTVISREHGMIDFYEENLGPAIKHDIQITTFPDVLKDYFTTTLEHETIASLNVNLEKMYYSYGPACWSTNYSYNDGVPVAACNADEDVINLPAWIDETQAATIDSKSWDEILTNINSAIIK